MANALLKPTVIAKEAAFQVVNNLVMARLANKQFVNEFKKIGDTVTYRKPVRFTVTDGAVLTVQDTVEQSDTLIINSRKHVGMQFLTQDLTMVIEEFSERYIKPACISLANQIDQDGAARYIDVYNAVGTPGVTPSTFNALGAAGQKMDEFAVPVNMRSLVLNPAAEWALMDGLKGVFQPTIVQDIIKEAALGRAAKMDIFGNQNIKKQTAGVPGGTPLIDAVGHPLTSGDAHIPVKGMTATTGYYNAGDIITLVGVNAVNPISKQDTGSLQQFVVTAKTFADGSTNIASLPVSPALISTGAYQTITALPADGAAITLVASHISNLAFHKNAFSLVTVPLNKPDGAAWAESVTYEGINIRIVKDYNITNDVDVARLDILYGWKTTYPELACRLMG